MNSNSDFVGREPVTQEAENAEAADVLCSEPSPGPTNINSMKRLVFLEPTKEEIDAVVAEMGGDWSDPVPFEQNNSDSTKP